MRTIALGLLACTLVGVAVALSRSDKPAESDLRIESKGRNPWTSLKLNNARDDFQFAIVSDRTGGHRGKVFSRAVARLNLLQPEFVVSVGDLIEGGAKKTDKQLAAEWEEFDGYVKKLTMPFFYVPGNHDVGAKNSDKVWQERLGRRHYHFVYRDVLFLCLNTDDPPGSGAGKMAKDQVDYAGKTLAANKGVRWTLVFCHKPIWRSSKVKQSGWLEVEKALANRPYTVFCGHVHRYQKYVRQGRAYYQLATTGGGSKMRGINYGEFDHIVWVTMKKNGPVLANIMLDGVLPDDLKVPDSAEKGVSRKLAKTFPARGSVFIDGTPVAGAYIVFTPVDDSKPKGVRADAVTDSDGTFAPSTYRASDGLAAGKYTIAISKRKPFLDPQGRPGPNLLPAKYASAKKSGLSVEIKDGKEEIKLELQK